MDVLDLLFISTLVGSVYLVYKFKIGQKIQKMFFKPDTDSALKYLRAVDPLSGEICERSGEEERGFGWGDFYDVRIPVKQIREYELASAHAKEHKGVPSDEQLQQMLLIRAIACIPAFRRIENETPEMEACFKKGNLPETNWKEVRAARDWMNEEFMEIQAEANRLIEGWGAHIIGHGVQKYDEITHQRHAHEMAQREEMMKARRRKAAQSQQKHDKEIERQQEVKRQRAADKMAEQILEEEQANSPRESPKEGLKQRKKVDSSPTKGKKKAGFKKGFLN